jgi:hypothetical protein
MSNSFKSKFISSIDASEYEEAASILKQELINAIYVDPRDDYSWGPESDILGYQILELEGSSAFNEYWEGLLKFFKDKLEPKWGHLHKGHLFFRLGLGHLATDVEKAKRYIVDALEEDRIVAENYAPQINETPIDLLHRFPSYVTLVILEMLEGIPWRSINSRNAFYRGLTPLRFDVIWDKKEMEPGIVRRSLEILIPESEFVQVLKLKEELDIACALHQSYSPIILTAAFMEAILYNRMRFEHMIEEIDGHPIEQLAIDDLLSTAIDQGLFATEAIASTFQMVHWLKINLLRPGMKSLKYKVTDETPYLIGYAMKILFDRALTAWAEERK